MLTETSALTQNKIRGYYHYQVRVEQLTYVGSAVTVDEGELQYVIAWIKIPSGIFVELYPLWENKNILMKTKIRIFNTNENLVLLYGCGTRKVIAQKQINYVCKSMFAKNNGHKSV